MNKRISTPLRFLLGGYLTFMGVKLLVSMIQEKPTDMVLKISFAVVFIVIGVWYLIQCGREAYCNHKEKQEQQKEEQLQLEAEEQEIKHRKLHSNTKFRTAPMNTEAINQASEEPAKEPAQEEKESSSKIVSLDLKDHDTDEESDYEEK